MVRPGSRGHHHQQPAFPALDTPTGTPPPWGRSRRAGGKGDGVTFNSGVLYITQNNQGPGKNSIFINFSSK